VDPPIVPEPSEDEFFQLLEKERRGDAGALGVLINRYRKYLLKIAFEEGDNYIQIRVPGKNPRASSWGLDLGKVMLERVP
jgi:hypothetical protein